MSHIDTAIEYGRFTKDNIQMCIRDRPEVVANADKCLEVMAHFKELSELQKIMAKRAGDRVVLK